MSHVATRRRIKRRFHVARIPAHTTSAKHPAGKSREIDQRFTVIGNNSRARHYFSRQTRDGHVHVHSARSVGRRARKRENRTDPYFGASYVFSNVRRLSPIAFSSCVTIFIFLLHAKIADILTDWKRERENKYSPCRFGVRKWKDRVIARSSFSVGRT